MDDDDAIVQLIPAPGWWIRWRHFETNEVLSDLPLVGWAVLADGEVAPVEWSRDLEMGQVVRVHNHGTTPDADRCTVYYFKP